MTTPYEKGLKAAAEVIREQDVRRADLHRHAPAQDADEVAIVATKDGDVRAQARFDGRPWDIADLIGLLQEWQETDPSRVIEIRAPLSASPTTEGK